MRFKKGTTSKESFKVIMHDLECLELKNTEDNKYHYDLLKGNLKDIWGIKNKMKCIKCKTKETMEYEDIGEGKYCKDCFEEEIEIWNKEAGFKN